MENVNHCPKAWIDTKLLFSISPENSVIFNMLKWNRKWHFLIQSKRWFSELTLKRCVEVKACIIGYIWECSFRSWNLL